MRNIILLPLLIAAIVFAVLFPNLAFAGQPYSVTSVTQGTCNGMAGDMLTFDNGETACVVIGLSVHPQVGPVDSFWHAYWDMSFPFYHSAGMTQGGHRFTLNGI